MFYEEQKNGYILRVRVTPNSSKCSTLGIFTDSTDIDYLKISLCTIPEKGKANQELIKYLSKTLKISKSSFSIISGKTDRLKKIFLQISPIKEITDALDKMEKIQ